MLNTVQAEGKVSQKSSIVEVWQGLVYGFLMQCFSMLAICG